ncbi:IPTL-CTERM sorting domain-containing protein [Seongchinamella sediminis]|uniref:IPTL-CTERM sorting domain-containing protein n=1 Tax=Seongchinamella sediminis TaxID=2283635 RepID=A0A3L7DUL9_9GAMM|nr:IPTL-CTERM sorting domain-containing protein [Seongchinamella sediminis]RLQ20300.1 IPTL-CTERM sorting domain-containing protein [Seongchinamella sediminis]
MKLHTWFGGMLLGLVGVCAPAGAQNLLTNGDFESGLNGWTAWNAPPSGFWNDTWIQSNDCDIWVPTNGCPYAGTISHAQKKGSGSGNTHGGLYQTLSVTAGQTYNVSGQWSGGVSGNLDGNNGSWWRVEVYDGTPTEAQIDAGPGAQDTLIALQEANNLATNGVFQFQWEAFSGSFTAPSDTVTLVLKSGSYYTFAAAAYHDDLVVIQNSPEKVPTLSTLALALLAGMLVFLGLRARRTKSGA